MLPLSTTQLVRTVDIQHPMLWKQWQLLLSMLMQAQLLMLQLVRAVQILPMQALIVAAVASLVTTQ
jgi:hypothetical protein